jgi:hypothetical protein
MTPEFINSHDPLRVANQLEEIFLHYVEGEDFTCLSGEDRGDLTKNMLDLIGFFRTVKKE